MKKKKNIKKRVVKRKPMKKKKPILVSAKKISKKKKKVDLSKVPTLNLRTSNDIGMDFSVKVYKKFDKLIKSVVLFGSAVKKTPVAGSDIDLILILDDVSVKWDQELIAWYRTELGKIVKQNPYKISIHINTIKLSTWWSDLLKGDPVVINIIRDGKALIDFGGFFEPLQYLLVEGKIKPSPEAIYSLLQRAPMHITRSRYAELSSIEGLFWSMVDSAQAALIAANVMPSSPEHLPVDLKQTFVDEGKLKMKYVQWYNDLLMLHKKIVHGHITDLKGVEIDDWQEKAQEFLKTMADLVNSIVG
jgi:predicted nucleotidyltransferase/uncharacterized protein (UPF0332 family)